MTRPTETRPTETRPAPILVPPLMPVLPPCPLCEAEVAYDGTSYWCEHCCATWGEADGFEPGKIEGVRCRSTIDAFARSGHGMLRGRVYRCALIDGHGSGRDPHRDPPIIHRGPRIDPAASPLAADVAGRVWTWRNDERGVSQVPAVPA